MSLMHHVTSLFSHTPVSSTPVSTATARTAVNNPIPLTGSAAAEDATSSTAASSDPPGTITASDFLTLLVTELKNQDPTSDQDPNAYITQLVGVNSLQQLIAINQDLTSAVDSSTATSGASGSQAIAGHPETAAQSPVGNAAGGPVPS